MYFSNYRSGAGILIQHTIPLFAGDGSVVAGAGCFSIALNHVAKVFGELYLVLVGALTMVVFRA